MGTNIYDMLFWIHKDDNRGMNSRWYVTFNFTMLRLVSFNLDYYWSLRQTREEKQVRTSYRSNKEHAASDLEHR